MKIVVLGSYAPSLINFRGSLIDAMIAAGHTVIGCAPENDPGVAADLRRRGAHYLPAPIARTGLNPVVDGVSVVRLAQLLHRLRPQLLLAYTSKPVIYGGLAARLARVPRVFALISGLGYAFGDGREVTRRVMRGLLATLYRSGLRAADGVFFQNPDDLAEFRRRAIVSDRHNLVRVNGSGVDLSHYPKVAPPAGRPVFLMIARLLRAKGVGEYVEAARMLRERHPDAVVRLLGPLDTNPDAITEAELRQWSAEGVIEYLGESEDVRPHLAASTVFVLPSYYREGVPRTVLEAMATGRAIITTDAPGCRETVVPGQNGFLVPAGNAEALACAMGRFVRRPELAVTFGAHSRQIAEGEFDVHRVNAVMLNAMGLV